MKSLIDPIKYVLSEPRNDGRLHFSQHLQHDRHAVLYMAYGYPHKHQPWGSVFPLLQGTSVHERLHEIVPLVVDKYNPEQGVVAEDGFKYPWVGSVDAFAQFEGHNWIFDYKTISGPSMEFLGAVPKPEHCLQVSAYHAFNPLRSDMVWRTAIIYFPSSPSYKRVWSEPVFMEFAPWDKEQVVARMLEVEAHIDAYKASGVLPDAPMGEFVWRKKYSFFECKWLPHYTSRFCPWGGLEDDPCGCSEAKSYAVAQYRNGELNIFEEYATMVDEIGLPDGVEE